MLGKQGIVRKTFLFAGLLIVLVTLVSFAILYFAMPSFYLYKKEQALRAGITRLEEDLNRITDREILGDRIAEFANTYNVTVTSTDSRGLPVIELSSPFVSLKTRETGNSRLVVNGEPVDERVLSSVFAQLRQVMSEREGQSHKTGEMEAYIMYDVGNVMLLEADIGNENVDKIQIQGTLQPIVEARSVMLSLIPYVLAAGCTIGLCLAWIYARRMTKPILKLSAAAVSMKNMEPDAVSWIDTDDELGILSENLNALYRSLSRTIRDLKAEMEKVNRLEQSKTEMMQSASHELKTPIAALSGMLDGMIDNIGVYKDKDIYLLKCREQVEKLSILVKEILDASRADRGGQADKRVWVEVDDMVGRIAGEYELPVNDKQLRLIQELEPVSVKTDPALLYRAIANLMSNAVMYTPPRGEIRIELSEQSLVIENQCSQIPEEEMPKLFEPFYTRSRSRDKLVSGTGLGLYIVRRNLESLSIPYEAASPKGRFRITLTFK